MHSSLALLQQFFRSVAGLQRQSGLRAGNASLHRSLNRLHRVTSTELLRALNLKQLHKWPNTSRTVEPEAKASGAYSSCRSEFFRRTKDVFLKTPSPSCCPIFALEILTLPSYPGSEPTVLR